jgi:phage tail-like protein
MSLPVGINALFAVVGNQTGRRLDPYASHNFLVEVSGLLVGGFSRVSGLESSLALKTYAEGGVNGYVHQIPGETRYPNLVLTQGYTGLDTLYGWYRDVSKGIIVRRSITIMLLSPRRAPVTWWNVRDAIPVKWVGPSFDASDESGVAVESVELVHKGIEKPLAGRLVELGRAAGEYVF